MYLFFDTETTGLPKSWKAPVTDLNNWPRLVQLAYLIYDQAGNELAAQDFIVRPDGFNIPAESARIHGISQARAEKEGIPISSVLQEFQKSMDQVQLVVAHNISFDEKIMGAEFLRNGMPNQLPGKAKLCTMQSSVDFCAIEGRYGYKWPKLSELYDKLFQSEFEEAHNAAVDIKATARCFWELKRQGVL